MGLCSSSNIELNPLAEQDVAGKDSIETVDLLMKEKAAENDLRLKAYTKANGTEITTKLGVAVDKIVSK